MPRARNIKPGLYKNEDLAECSVWSRYIFPGLWTLADREGRLEDRPKRIKGELLPFDAQDVEPLLRELAAKGFIVRYEIDGQRFIQITKFKEHQSPHYTEKQSVIKGPTLPENGGSITTQNSGSPWPIKEGSKPPDSLIPDSLIHRFTDSPNPDSPIPGKKAEARATRLPPAWTLPPDWQEWAMRTRSWTAGQALAVADAFRDHWVAKPGKDGRKLDWEATWRNWVRKERNPARGAGGGNQAAAAEAKRRLFGQGGNDAPE